MCYQQLPLWPGSVAGWRVMWVSLQVVSRITKAPPHTPVVWVLPHSSYKVLGFFHHQRWGSSAMEERGWWQGNLYKEGGKGKT
jgi:hypothetical protein